MACVPRMSGRLDYVVRPGGTFRGRLTVPGDKSISHRALLLGALAAGVTDIEGMLEAEDCLATLAALRALGVAIERLAPARYRIQGTGLTGFKAPERVLDLGNSGTSMRLLAGVLAGQPFATTLTGDASLRRRPMARVAEPLRRMGAHIEATPVGTAPLRIHGQRPLRALDYTLPVASAQVKSAILLAALYADGPTSVHEPLPARDHTERMLRAFGVDCARDGQTIRLVPGMPRACRVIIPGDFSSAAFFIAAAAATPGAELVVEGVGLNATRTALLDLLRDMGAGIETETLTEAGGEPVGRVCVRGAVLHGIDVPPACVPRVIDDIPALLVAASCAHGTTRITGAAELRHKESDRLAALAEGFAALGIATEQLTDGIVVHGGTLGGGSIASRGDHRIAMAFALAGTRATAPVRVRDCRNVATSFPDFVARARALGIDLTVEEAENDA